jgi:protein-disulfide isomerase
MLDGIAQRGNVLGSPTAPVRLVEYADPQCPFCAVYARDVLPTLVREYVRTGKVQLVFRGLAFLGPGSVTALRTAAAASSENKMWNVLELLFRNQGPENAWVTDELLRSIVVAAGADADRVVAERDGAAVGSMIDSWARTAQTGGVQGVPAFFVGRGGASLQRVAPRQLAVPEFRAALDAALAG